MTATSPSATALHPVLPGLWATAPQPLPFGPATVVRAFLLEREAGNLLVYSADTLTAHRAEIQRLGGVERHYLNHWHEARYGGPPAGAPLFVHAADRAQTERTHPVRAAFTTRHRFGDDLEVIPVPGHTAGATGYLWDSGEHRVLFTGDSLYLHGERWVAAALSSSDRSAYVASLELLGELEFDVLVPWAATDGHPFHAIVGHDEARARIAEVADRIRRGSDR